MERGTTSLSLKSTSWDRDTARRWISHHIEEGLHTSSTPPRSVRVKLKSGYKEEVLQLCDEGIIMPVWKHTEWTNSTVLVRKADSSLRLCLDPKDFNKNIERKWYYTRTIGNLSTELHRFKYFTLMEPKSGHWIVCLDKESSLLIMFNIPWEKYRLLWLPFSLSVSSNVFQEWLDATINTVPGATGIVDGVLAEEDSEINYDIAVLSLLKTTRSTNLNFNTDKIQFKTWECNFFGHLLTPEGMSIDLNKVNAIKLMGAPQCKKELESFQGVINYLKCYSSWLTQVEESSKELLRNDIMWCWESRHQEVF